MCFVRRRWFKLTFVSQLWKQYSTQTKVAPKVKPIPIQELENFLVGLFECLKLSEKNCRTMANVIIEADKRGKYAHGVVSLPKYLTPTMKGQINIKGEPKIIKETSASALVSGENCLGPIVGKLCMELAIEKAEVDGAAIVCANNSNYFGMASYYSLMAIEKFFIGISMSNSPPMMLIPNGQEALLGANPLAFSARATKYDLFNLDMACSKISKEEALWRAKLKETIPPGAALNRNLKPTREGCKAFISNKFLPFDGSLGYGMGSAVEILTGVLSGANFSSNFPSKISDCPVNIGHCFIVINPYSFYSRFGKIMNVYLNTLRQIKPIIPNEPICVPGDLGEILGVEAAQLGITYNDVQKEILRTVATKFSLSELNEYICD